MAASENYLDIDAGKIKQFKATTTNVSAGTSRIVATNSSTGRIDDSLLPTGLGAETISVVTIDILKPGDFVNIQFQAGSPATAVARLACADGAPGTTYPAVGFVLENFSIGATAKVYTVSMRNTAITNPSVLEPGNDYYLSKTPGLITTIPPNSTRDIVQYIGKPDTIHAIVFANVNWIELA